MIAFSPWVLLLLLFFSFSCFPKKDGGPFPELAAGQDAQREFVGKLFQPEPDVTLTLVIYHHQIPLCCR